MPAWLPGCSQLDLIGSFTPAMREADDDCFRGARLYIDTEAALEDLAAAMLVCEVAPSV